MKNMSTNQIRRLWLKFFKEKKHIIIKPASLIPVNDDTLLWVNSGVAALKNYFDGSIKPASPRLTNSQPSIRTNDIENVGVTARHHTLFEMLGNFSIGDYFKEEAIIWGWEFLTDKKWLNLDKDKFYITIYEEDNEAYDIWVDKIGIEADRIIKGNKETNFWEIGQGPCGPNTEIFYDRGEKYDPNKIGIKLLKKDIENDRYLEIWNIVFSQFNNKGDGTYTDLPQKNIDTGMGLERTASIMQGAPTNYDTDQFQIIINEIAKHTNKKYDIDNFFKPTKEQSKINTAYKAISDHIKCNVFAIGDGAIPSNEKRGYILRRLLRRSVNMARILDINKPFLSELVDVIADYHKDFFPHLLSKKDHIKEVIKAEEIKFLETIHKGHNKLELIISKKGKISGEDAFLLFNSFGFPIELTQEIAKEKNIDIEINRFYKLFKKHNELARSSFKSSGQMNIQLDALSKFNVKSIFLYEPTKHKSKVVGIIQDDQIKDKATGKMWLAFEETIFYVESGGQISDEGTVNGIEVSDLMKAPNGTRLHKVNSSFEIKIGDDVKLEIWNQRPQLMAHHSGSHLVHQVVKEMFGHDSNQAGKYVANNRLRFDFTTTKKITSDMMVDVEKLVNEKIAENNKSLIREMPYQEAIDGGAIALFAEKYIDIVRTVKIGDSFELCGGTHVFNSKVIEQFTITSFESKGSGVYRIEGICTKILCEKWNQKKNKKLEKEYTTFISKHSKYDYFVKLNIDINSKYKNNLKLFKEYKSRIIKLNKEYQQRQMKEQVKSFIGQENQIKNINGVNVLVFESEVPLAFGKEVIAHYKNVKKDLVLIWASQEKSKISIIVAVGDDYRGKLSAKNILNSICKFTDGKGGGSDLLAQAGGENPQGFKLAIEKLGKFINV